MQNLILLHGGIGSKSQFDLLAKKLSDKFLIRRFNFPGHGGRAFAANFSIQQFSEELISYMDSLPDLAKPVYVLGYSMGGYVAAYTSLQYPERFTKIITLATKWQWDEVTAQKETAMLDAKTLETKVPAFAEKLKVLHAPNDWKELLKQSVDLLTCMGQRPPIDVNRLPEIKVPVCVLVGDRDKTVSVEETMQVYRKMPGASFGVLPDTPHPFEKVDVELLSNIIIRYCSENEK